MKEVEINKLNYVVNDSEYEIENHQEFCNLKILRGLGYQERMISLLREMNHVLLMSSSKKNTELHCIGSNHGGYMEIEMSRKMNRVSYESNDENISVNLLNHRVNNVTRLSKTPSAKNCMNELLFYVKNQKDVDLGGDENENELKVIVLENSKLRKEWNNYEKYKLSRVEEIYVLVQNDFLSIFDMYFQNYLDKSEKVLNYDNLIHYALMVKNGGDTMREVIQANMPFIDEYTILDTGSTDNTVKILKEELDRHKKRGKIVSEPFLNFRDSRNRCLDLCGVRCKYIVMLDDTYILKNDVRAFLEYVRGDQFSDSLSLYICSDDVEYGSNRVIRSDRNHLRYKYKLHEVITPENNMNVIIPKHYGYIYDVRSDYMESRTMNRKEYDIRVLNEMVEEDKDDSRAYYYLGQTYSLLGRDEEAYESFLKRINHKDVGFIQEKIDAVFEAGRIANFRLNKKWEDVEKLYLMAYEMDKSRPDSLYFLGIHYYMERDYEKAYQYFLEGFRVGYPEHCQYSLKPSLSYYYLPKFFAEVCYILRDFENGYKSCVLFLESYRKREGNWWKKMDRDEMEKDYYMMRCWEKIFLYILKGKQRKVEESSSSKVEEIKSRLVFIVNGGFGEWRGSDILKKGMGGSETFIVEISRYIKKYDEVVVFCNCGGGEEKEEEFEGVLYKNLIDFEDYLKKNVVDMVVVSRYPEYLGTLYENENVKEVRLILHDMIPVGEVILRNPKLSKIMLLSHYHKRVFDEMFHTLRDITEVFGYGIDGGKMEKAMRKVEKVKNRFIYSSTANRGLLMLLRMWGNIRAELEGATLYIHCDIYNHKWLNEMCGEEMNEIRMMIEKGGLEGVVYKGWVSKEELYKSWGEAEVWFYPTMFLETFCLTALEAGVSRTLIVTMKIGSLDEVVGERGVVLNYNLLEDKGREKVMEELIGVMRDEERKKEYVEKNYEYCKKLTWAERSKDFV